MTHMPGQWTLEDVVRMDWSAADIETLRAGVAFFQGHDHFDDPGDARRAARALGRLRQVIRERGTVFLLTSDP